MHATIQLGRDIIAIRDEHCNLTIYDTIFKHTMSFSPSSASELRDFINLRDITQPPKIAAYHWLGADAETP